MTGLHSQGPQPLCNMDGLGLALPFKSMHDHRQGSMERNGGGGKGRAQGHGQKLASRRQIPEATAPACPASLTGQLPGSESTMPSLRDTPEAEQRQCPQRSFSPIPAEQNTVPHCLPGPLWPPHAHTRPGCHPHRRRGHGVRRDIPVTTAPTSLGS